MSKKNDPSAERIEKGHTTHFDDCGCLSARLKAECDRLFSALEAAQKESKDYLRRAIDNRNALNDCEIERDEAINLLARERDAFGKRETDLYALAEARGKALERIISITCGCADPNWAINQHGPNCPKRIAYDAVVSSPSVALERFRKEWEARVCQQRNELLEEVAACVEEHCPHLDPANGRFLASHNCWTFILAALDSLRGEKLKEIK